MMRRFVFQPIDPQPNQPRWLTHGQLDPQAPDAPGVALIGSLTFEHTLPDDPLREVNFLAYRDGVVRLSFRWASPLALEAVAERAVPLIRRPLIRVTRENTLLTLTGRFLQRADLTHFLATVAHLEAEFLQPRGFDQYLGQLLGPYLQAQQQPQPNLLAIEAERRLNATPELPYPRPLLFAGLMGPQGAQVPGRRRIVAPLPEWLVEQNMLLAVPEPQPVPIQPPAPIPTVNADRLEAAHFEGRIPEHLICPVSLSIIDRAMRIPGTPGNFNEAHIREWLNRRQTHPLTRAEVHANQLEHDPVVQRQIDAFMNEHAPVAAPVLRRSERLANKRNAGNDEHHEDGREKNRIKRQ